ncbi:FadR/GntR family transcriptional regulator [Sphingomonas sp. BK069]|uniref:FadR/GntR family transcriptional regulator n=1 Tax=Sphingomonas sp. BK069 TaxID=2586979 RepID=UPI001607CB47|nr:GntR family transcriptional regulator [Sphingomonas sp. BK069]MBB3349733.1 DNA-binding FadR family transcriptional regulator [Sphingomonas sp. BK069]
MARQGEGLYKRIAYLIRDDLVNESSRSGRHIPSERELMARFKVSRSTIREALIALEYIGTTEKNDAGRIQVPYHIEEGADDDIEDATNILAAHRLIEGQVAALAAIVSDVSQGLRGRMEGCKSILTENSFEMLRSIHLSISGHVGNEVVNLWVRTNWLKNEPALRRAFDKVHETALLRTSLVEAQLDLSVAIQRGNSNAARQAMHQSFDTLTIGLKAHSKSNA